jgi:antirestriction protein
MFYFKADVWITALEIVEVDTSRPWHITDYDGVESIEYLDYEIIDPTTYYCELKKG